MFYGASMSTKEPVFLACCCLENWPLNSINDCIYCIYSHWFSCTWNVLCCRYLWIDVLSKDTNHFPSWSPLTLTKGMFFFVLINKAFGKHYFLWVWAGSLKSIKAPCLKSRVDVSGWVCKAVCGRSVCVFPDWLADCFPGADRVWCLLRQTQTTKAIRQKTQFTWPDGWGPFIQTYFPETHWCWC